MSSHPDSRRHADVIVVGAGSAGCVLAARLAERGVDTLLLEAGGSHRTPNVSIPAAFTKLYRTKRDWADWTVPQGHLDGRRIFWPHGRMTGGSSAMNAQMYVRGHRADFDEWAAAGNDGWSYDDLLDYFTRSEDNGRGGRLHGTGGPQHVCDQVDPNPLSIDFVASARAAGIPACDDLAAPDLQGVGLTQVTQWHGRRWSAADAFLLPARPLLRVRTDSQVARVLIDGGRAVGVEFCDGRRQYAEHVVVCAGTVGSPQLLLRSGVGPATDLRQLGIEVQCDLPGVGANLQDHLVCPVVADVTVTHTLAAAERPASLLRYLLFRRGLLSSNAAEAAAFVGSSSAGDLPDLELVFLPVPFEQQGLGKPDRHALTIGVALLRPGSRGRISLTSSDPLAAPSIDPDYLSAAGDLDRLIDGIGIAEQVLATGPLADRLRLRRPIADAAGHVRTSAQSLYHPVGTCRMGIDDDAAVDPALRVNGIQGLTVADASVMPTITRGHTNAPTMALAEKAADLVLGARTTAIDAVGTRPTEVG